MRTLIFLCLILLISNSVLANSFIAHHNGNSYVTLDNGKSWKKTSKKNEIFKTRISGLNLVTKDNSKTWKIEIFNLAEREYKVNLFSNKIILNDYNGDYTLNIFNLTKNELITIQDSSKSIYYNFKRSDRYLINIYFEDGYYTKQVVFN